MDAWLAEIFLFLARLTLYFQKERISARIFMAFPHVPHPLSHCTVNKFNNQILTAMKKALQNQMTLSGRVANLEIRSFSTGKSVARFSLALNRTETKDGHETKHTCFIPFECWRAGNDAFADLTKGQLLTIEAAVRPETYVDRNGTTQNKAVWVVNKYYATPDLTDTSAE